MSKKTDKQRSGLNTETVVTNQHGGDWKQSAIRDSVIDVQIDTSNGRLIVRLPLNRPPTPSASGKTMVVASTRGNVRTAAVYQGKPITVGLNAYIAK